MTQKKQLKARVRARMARTGESYVTALRHVATTGADDPAAKGGAAGATRGAASAGAAHGAASAGASVPESPVVDLGYALRGGLHPESANIAHVLAHHGIRAMGGEPVTEALVFGIGGGPGAGYILWEFKRHATATLVMGFHNSWQYPDRWHQKTLDRLGVKYLVDHTSGAAGAAKRLTELLAAGRPCIIRPDRYYMGYWRMPEYKEAQGGPDVVVYAERGDGVHVDDRNVSPLIVPRDKVDEARARVVSYKNSLYAIDPASGQIPAETLRAAVRAGLADCVEHLSAASDSFSLPAWRKWARLLTDQKNAKAWPRVFAERKGGLAGALLSVWEDIMPAGGYGGHLRDLYAEFLDQAAVLVENPRLHAVAESFRGVSESWHRVAETALPDTVAPFARLRDLTVAVRQAIVDPAAVTAAEADQAAADLWALREELDGEFPLGDAEVGELLAALSGAVEAVYTRETEAVAQLKEVVGGG
ncbi:MAG TPA: BtrH N-terminal domain-containing protein [Chloroflexota bacterium]|nr:BtrH N-terminal domain-containing protein [Chloroflexota bacterium]